MKQVEQARTPAALDCKLESARLAADCGHHLRTKRAIWRPRTGLGRNRQGRGCHRKPLQCVIVVDILFLPACVWWVHGRSAA